MKSRQEVLEDKFCFLERVDEFSSAALADRYVFAMKTALNRRNFLKAAGLSLAGAGVLGAPLARAIEPLARTGPARFRVSLVAYSFRDSFAAKDPAKKIDLFRFLDFAAEHGCDGVEVTQYYFPA